MGERLYPLNTLKDKLPDIYKSAVEKYKGREWLLDVSIPGLDVLWNDVIHFSLMHPELIYKTLTDVGFESHKYNLTWIEIPIEDVISMPSTLYLNTRPWQDTKVLLSSDFEDITPERVKELSGMPEANLEYYRNCLRNNEMPLLWKRAPHILVKGELNISGYKTIDWHPRPIAVGEKGGLRLYPNKKKFDYKIVLAILGACSTLPLVGGAQAWGDTSMTFSCRASQALEVILIFPFLLFHPVVFLWGIVSSFILLSFRAFINWKYFFVVALLLYIIIFFAAISTKTPCPSIFNGF